MLIQTVEGCVDTRLDRYLAESVGRMSLRGWRRAIKMGHVYVNGKPVKPGMTLQGGETLQIRELKLNDTGLKGQFVGRASEYLFFYKPAGLHSAALAGSAEDSLENQLSSLYMQDGQEEHVQLLQRLDQGTAGLVCAAINSGAAINYRNAERASLSRKNYLALLEGSLDSPVRTAAKLDVNGGKRVRLGIGEEEESWTEFEPIRLFKPNDSEKIATLAKCTLCSGKRHQIRAHAAALGFPLIGDSLYGSQECGDFLLLHYRIEFPGVVFYHLPQDSPFTQFGCMLDGDGNLQCI